MTIRYVDNRVERALSEVLSQYGDNDKLCKVVALLNEQVQQIENVVFDLFIMRTLEGAQAAQLDQLGRVVGETRGELTEAEYKRFIAARLMLWFADGGRDKIKRYFRTVTRSENVRFQPNYPASFLVEYLTREPLSDAVRARIDASMADLAASGVAWMITEAKADDFGFLEDPDALGFNEGTFATTTSHNT